MDFNTLRNLFDQPLNDLLFKAHQIHRKHHQANQVQLSTLLNIKTGACPEDCKYCSQSSHYHTSIEREKLLSTDAVVEKAKSAKKNGATRFCMGAAWRNPTDKNLDKVIDMIAEVKKLGMESCLTCGMLTKDQAQKLKENGLDYYNHNLDTSKEYYPKVITTRKFQDRIDTLQNVSAAGLNVCSGGILGLGESVDDRASMLFELASLNPQPQSVPINMLVPIEGTPFGDNQKIDPIDFVKMIAITRIAIPKAQVRLSAGRDKMSGEMQALCFFAGANSIFYGDDLLTTENQSTKDDQKLFEKLGISAEVTPRV